MLLNYLLDIGENSSSYIYTPSLMAQQFPFYLHNCGHFYSKADYYTERDGQDNYLLIYTLTGSGVVRYRGLECSTGPGQILLINCNEYHHYKTGPEGRWEIKWLHFNGTASKNYSDLINEDSFLVISLLNPKDTEKNLDAILNLASKSNILNDARYSMFITNILTEMVLSKLNTANNRNFTLHIRMVDEAIDYIQQNYTNKVNIEDIINIVHISEYHFLRLFKRYTGMGLYEYLINYRINKSKSLLKETSMSVNEITYSVGFNNINNFIRDFKRLVGTTPLKYRNYWIG